MVDANGMMRPLAAYVPGAEPGRWVSGGDGWRIEKRYALEDDALCVSFRVEGSRLPATIETEINLAMPSCDGFGGRYVLADGRVPGGFGDPLQLEDMRSLTLDDSELHGALRIEASQPVRLDARPHRTVSQSEAGFEKIMQAVCMTLSWSPTSGAEQIVTLRVIPAS
jgi:hypothetical protein